MINLAGAEVNTVATAASEPLPQPDPDVEPEDIWLARLASLTDADAPPDEDDYARLPDPAYR